MKGFVRSARSMAAAVEGIADRDSKTTADTVQQHEFERHIGPGRAKADVDDGPLVGICLSGGGIRSATFGLGVLQALRSLGVFKQLDYISTVSGGGYIGGWLQGIMARGGLDEALPDETIAPVQTTGRAPDRFEARQIRFLRAFSNYLTPRLGLFSGDTWAAVGNTLRNLVLNLGVLSLSLIPALYLPWILIVMFWRLVPSGPLPIGQLSVAGLLLAFTLAISTLNMSRPLKDGSWDTPVGRQLATWQVLAFVVTPALMAVFVMTPIVWVWAVHRYFESGRLLSIVLIGGIAYGAIDFVGVISGYGIGRFLSRGKTTVQSDTTRLVKALSILVTTSAVSGGVGALCGALASRGVVDMVGPEHQWLIPLLLYPIGVLALLLCVAVHIGLAGNWLSDETREWWGRVGGVELFVSLLLVMVATLSLAGPHLWTWVSLPAALSAHADKINLIVGALWAAITGTGVVVGRSSKTDGDADTLVEKIGRLAPAVFVVGYLLILATILHHTVSQPLPPSMNDGSDWFFSFEDVEDRLQMVISIAQSDAWNTSAYMTGVPLYEMSLLVMTGVFFILAIRVSRSVDLNEFSLHALYRNRIVRCYLGASNPTRSAHPFTGFDPRDDLPLRTRSAEAAGLPPPIRPYPIFNVAMNLVAGKNLAWQQRKAAAFMFSPEYCGFEYRIDEDDEQERRRKGIAPAATPLRRSAYAPTADHGNEPRSLTVGLAVATSGAAASPNMGYHTSPTLAFLMTIFNVRLGRWVRNPRWIDVWTDRTARLSLRELMSELLGMTTDDRNWVYLSDGGHFENLGLYELVRRRCRMIIVCDAGQDGAVTFEDLGNAIEKVRADFDLNIEIDLSAIRHQPDSRFSAAHCAIGTIRYDQQNPDDPLGTLLYLKSSLTGDEPADVLRYASEHLAFPHESTSDQFFDESQFESYRALGYHVACTTLTAAAEPDEITDMSAVGLFTQLRQHWTLPAPAPADAVRKYSRALSEVWNLVRSNDSLRFLDPQMFPEWTNLLLQGGGDRESLASLPQPDRGTVNYWLPTSAEERRAGFYACNQMLQLMEDVYLEFKLDEHYDHIDNRGWMNLFQHWAWSGMLSATWAVTGSTYDPRFQRFCIRRLGLSLGKPYLYMAQEYALPLTDEWRSEGFDKRKWLSDWETGTAGLNFWEVQLVDRFLSQSAIANRLQLIPIRVVTESPRRDGDNLDFNVGYVIAHIDWDTGTFYLHHMRIQNHLRKMGLARQALRMVTGQGIEGHRAGAAADTGTRERWGLKLAVVIDEAIQNSAGRTENIALDEALPTRAAAIRLQRIISSLGR